FDGGCVRVGTPVAAQVSARNGLLDEDPGVLVRDSYGEGWIVDLCHVEESELAQLMSADAARRQARLDLRLFRRRIALHLLADDSDIGPPLSDEVELPSDPWHVLGGAAYPELVRELVH
ncbi:MAG: hypothetical protein C4547_08770, partial [Phycisphaerales bacterium]